MHLVSVPSDSVFNINNIHGNYFYNTNIQFSGITVPSISLLRPRRVQQMFVTKVITITQREVATMEDPFLHLRLLDLIVTVKVVHLLQVLDLLLILVRYHHPPPLYNPHQEVTILNFSYFKEF